MTRVAVIGPPKSGKSPLVHLLNESSGIDAGPVDFPNPPTTGRIKTDPQHIVVAHRDPYCVTRSIRKRARFTMTEAEAYALWRAAWLGIDEYLQQHAGIPVTHHSYRTLFSGTAVDDLALELGVDVWLSTLELYDGDEVHRG